MQATAIFIAISELITECKTVSMLCSIFNTPQAPCDILLIEKQY